MKVLIKQANIVHPRSPHHGQVRDILVINGLIKEIAATITADEATMITGTHLHVSSGWVDCFADFADPGYEHRETMSTGAAAAAAGGFTDVFLIPNSSPVVSSKSQVEYILQNAARVAVNLHPLASISKNAEGKELAEMYDMHRSGALAFTDGIHSVQSPGLVLKALQYLLAIDGTLIQLPDDKSVGGHGLMNEGIMSTRLGLPGKPAIGEELMIARDIELLRYTKSRLHITGISTQKGIDLVRAAKKEGLNLTCSATAYHAGFCDEDLNAYDTNLKVNPPLRSRADRNAVKTAIADGTIDCLSSHHSPQHLDDKACEFEYAKNGMIGLETLFAAVNEFHPDLTLLVEQLTDRPRKIFGLPLISLEAGAEACLTIFEPSETFVYESGHIRSKSKNTAYIGCQLKGKVSGIINKNQLVINKQ
ncbi:MAG: dihydroorotase, multifunctional complex type [Ferruginibacter sp.]|nr:dihydroorotase, multifunctional complex type [Ferruginibacter sp.]